MATLKDNKSFQIDLIEVGNVLSQYKVELEELLKKKIKDKNSVASGDLLASIHTRLEVNGTSFEVWLDCLKYLKFLDQGTKPHWMPEEPIIKWIKDKKLPTREYTGSDSLPTEKQLGFLIRRKIANEGTLPNFVYVETIQELNEKYIPLVEQALTNDVINYFSTIGIHYELSINI